MPFSTYSGNKIINLLLRGMTFTAPSRVYISLHTADPTVAGNSEVLTSAWPSYVRLDPAQGGAVANGFAVANEKATTNAITLLYPRQNGIADVAISHFGIWDAATGGNMLLYGELLSPKILQPDDECVIYQNELGVSVI